VSPLRTISRAGLVWLAGAVAIAQTQAAPAPSIEAYGRLPTIEMAALSPDGTKLATVQTVGAERVLAVSSIDDGKLLGGVRLAEIKMRGLIWADDRHVLPIWVSSETPFDYDGPKVEYALIQSYDGTPTAYGEGLRRHLARR